MRQENYWYGIIFLALQTAQAINSERCIKCAIHLSGTLHLKIEHIHYSEESQENTSQITWAQKQQKAYAYYMQRTWHSRSWGVDTSPFFPLIHQNYFHFENLSLNIIKTAWPANSTSMPRAVSTLPRRPENQTMGKLGGSGRMQEGVKSTSQGSQVRTNESPAQTLTWYSGLCLSVIENMCPKS